MITGTLMRRLRLLLGLTIPSVMAPCVAADERESVELETVVVTAEKREEDAQDLPLSLQSLDGEMLAVSGIDEVYELGSMVPSLQFTSVAGFPIVFIRGLGSDNFLPSADPSVATYIDGIYTPMGMSALTSLNGIERVEVVKGPQGTLFGRDATAGAINMITADPAAEPSVAVRGELASRDGQWGRIAVSGPLADSTSAGLFVDYRRQDSPFTNSHYAPSPDISKSVGGKLVFEPGAHKLLFAGFLGERSGTESLIAQNVDPSLLGQIALIPPQEDSFHAHNDYPAFQRATQRVGYGIYTWHAEPVTFKALASVQRLHAPESAIDFDASPVPLAAISTDNTFANLETAELQLLSNDASDLDGRLTWVSGLYLLKSRTGQDQGHMHVSPRTVSSLLALLDNPLFTGLGEGLEQLIDALGLEATPIGSGGLQLDYSGVIRTESYAAYGQATYDFNDHLSFTVGGRYQWETRDLIKAQTQLASPIGNGGIPLRDSSGLGESRNTFSPKLAASWHFSDDATAYASYSVAYKSGTYNIVNLFSDPEFIPPEKAASVEVGLKFEYRSRLRLNAAIFNTEVDDLQSGFVSVASGGIVNFISVPHARSRGADFELQWLPFEAPLLVTVAAAYIDAEYTDYPNGRGFSEGSGLYDGSIDLSGNTMVFAPQWSGNVRIGYLHPVREGHVEVSADAYFNSGYYTDANNTTREGGYGLLNLRSGYYYAPWRATAMLFCDNALDRRYHAVNAATDFGNVKSLADPRTYGVRLSWTF